MEINNNKEIVRIKITDMDAKNKISLADLIQELYKAQAKGVIDYNIHKYPTGSCYIDLYLHPAVPTILEEINQLKSKIEELEKRAEELNCN